MCAQHNRVTEKYKNLANKTILGDKTMLKLKNKKKLEFVFLDKKMVFLRFFLKNKSNNLNLATLLLFEFAI